MPRRLLQLLALSLFVLQPLSSAARLINGTPVPEGKFKEVVNLKINNVRCQGTVVGPRTILTAAHCGATGAKTTVSIAGNDYEVTLTRSSKFVDQDHNVAVAIATKDITGVDPATIGGKAEKNVALTLLGAGCTKVGPGSTTDNVLRMGDTDIVDFKGLAMVSSRANGALLCFGEGGGPAYVKNGTGYLLLGINSTSDVQTFNYSIRTDIQETKDFLNEVITNNTGLKICGINKECGNTQPTAPTCTLAADPNSINKGQSLTLRLTPQGNFTSASIDGTSVTAPNFSKSFAPGAAGTFTATGSVTGPGGTNTCIAQYTVKDTAPTAPTCTIAVNPSSVLVGQTVTAALTTQGTVTSAQIDGVAVVAPNYSRSFAPGSVGTFNATGSVTGPGGTNSCTAQYTVTENNGQIACEITASPSRVKTGDAMTLTLKSIGNVTIAQIDGAKVDVPVGTKIVKPATVGTFSALGLVTGPAGSKTCSVVYTVHDGTNTPPTCTLSAVPNQIKLGQSLTLMLDAQGEVTSATVNGQRVNVPLGTLTITPTAAGAGTGAGVVNGPGGTGTCSAMYRVEDDQPEAPALAVMPTFCGDNVEATDVSRVCLAVLKRDSHSRSVQFTDVLLVTYKNARQEVLPVLHRKPKALEPGDLRKIEDLTLYANRLAKSATGLVLDSRNAVLTHLPATRSGANPASLEGWTATGQYFSIERLHAAQESRLK